MNKAEETMNQSIETKIEVALDQLKRVREDIQASDQKTENKFQRLEEKIDNQYVLKVEYLTEITSLKQRISELEANQRWITRGIIGAVVSTIIGFFYAFKQ